MQGTSSPPQLLAGTSGRQIPPSHKFGYSAYEKSEKVWYYGLKLFDREGELLKEINIPSDFAMYNQKDVYTYLFPEPDKQVISAEVTAVGFFGNRSESISKTL